MLTVPKIKDLVNTPNKKYENIYNTIYQGKENQNTTQTNVHTNVQTQQTQNSFGYNKDELLPKADVMKDELKSFFKKQLEDKNTFPDTVNSNQMNQMNQMNQINTTNIQELDTIQSASSFYEFK